ASSAALFIASPHCAAPPDMGPMAPSFISQFWAYDAVGRTHTSAARSLSFMVVPSLCDAPTCVDWHVAPGRACFAARVVRHDEPVKCDHMIIWIGMTIVFIGDVPQMWDR